MLGALDSLAGDDGVAPVAAVGLGGDVFWAENYLAAAAGIKVYFADVRGAGSERAGVVQLDSLVQKGHVIVDIY